VRREELKKGATANKEYVVDMCLTAKRKDLQPNFYNNDKNPDALIYDNATAVATMAVFLNGSFDTTLNSTSWTLYWFAKHPDIQKKFQEELDKSGLNLKPGCPTPSKEDLEKIPYLDCVIREGMRKMPAAPINMRINFDKDYDIDNLDKESWGKYGYKDKVTIQAGTTVILPYHCAMMKEDVFGADCPVFNPDRFMGSDSDAKVQQCKQMWTPFGGHKRMCVGQNFAKQEIRLFLSILLSRYTFKLKNPDEKVGAKYEAGINVIDVLENDKSTGRKPIFIVEKR
jgi:cytochrome P450